MHFHRCHAPGRRPRGHSPMLPKLLSLVTFSGHQPTALAAEHPAGTFERLARASLTARRDGSVTPGSTRKSRLLVSLHQPWLQHVRELVRSRWCMRFRVFADLGGETTPSSSIAVRWGGSRAADATARLPRISEISIKRNNCPVWHASCF